MAKANGGALAGALPTINMGGTLVDDLLQSVRATLAADTDGQTLVLYQYAPSVGGWRLVEKAILDWMKAKKDRIVEAFVGTDHGLTDPVALEEMRKAKVQVNILTDYSGIYHPKVFALHGKDSVTAWMGSNNLTTAGLSKNIELAFVATGPAMPAALKSWDASIRASSEPLSDALLKSYSSEREKHKQQKVKQGVKDFVWSKRKKGSPKKGPVKKAGGPGAGAGAGSGAAPAGSLVMEIMPKETGTGGKQIQPPMATLPGFFKLTGTSKLINASLAGSGISRKLTLTQMGNSTARLEISELDYGDRPCYIVFERKGPNTFEYEIVSQSVQPARYATLEKQAVNQTSPTSRRWAII